VKAKKCRLFNFLTPGFSSQSKSEQSKAYNKLFLVAGDSWGVRQGSKGNKNQPSHSFFPFLWLLLSLDSISVALYPDGFFFLGGSSTYGVRQHRPAALCCLGLVTALCL